MFTFPPCVVICFARFAFFALSCLVFFTCLHFCTFVYMFMHMSLCACLCHQAQFLYTISCRFTLVFCTWDLKSLLGTLLDGTHVLSILQYNGTMDLNPNPHLSFLDTLFCLITCLFDNMLVSPFVCFPLFVPLCAFFCLLVFSMAYLLAWCFFCCHFIRLEWGSTSKMQAKRQMQARRCNPKNDNVQ